MAVIVCLAALPVSRPLDVGSRDALAIAAPLILLGYVLVVNGARLLRGRVPVTAREAAWAKAREVDEADAWLGRMVAGWVPVGLALALGVLLWPHLTDPNPALACAWAVLGLPPIAIAWLVASSSWLDACRDDLARAEEESEARFRRYWANPGR